MSKPCKAYIKDDRLSNRRVGLIPSNFIKCYSLEIVYLFLCALSGLTTTNGVLQTYQTLSVYL